MIIRDYYIHTDVNGVKTKVKLLAIHGKSAWVELQSGITGIVYCADLSEVPNKYEFVIRQTIEAKTEAEARKKVVGPIMEKRFVLEQDLKKKHFGKDQMVEVWI